MFSPGIIGYSLAAGGGDPYFANVSALLHMDGVDGSTTFTDVTGKTWTVTGNAQIDTAQSKFGGASGLFDGAGDYITSPSHAGFTFGTSDFTVEKWARFSSFSTTPTLLDNRLGSYGASLAIYNAAATTELRFFSNGADRAASGSLSTATWYHVALSRASGTSRFFINGTQVGSDYADTNSYNGTQLRFGANFTGGNSLNGWLDDLRITKGVGRYTTNFTPPSAAFPDS